MNFHEFCDSCAQLMVACGGRITSWGRSPFGNDEVGGVVTSNHTIMMAVDWAWSEAEIMATTVSNGAGTTMNGRERMKTFGPRLGLQVIDKGDHLHVQPRSL